MAGLLPTILLILVAVFAASATAELNFAPLVTYTLSNTSCAGGDCTTSFYNTPNQCNPAWAHNGTVTGYFYFTEVCSMSAGFFQFTTYSDAACTIAPKPRVVVLSSVGTNIAFNGLHVNFKCEGGDSEAAEKPFIYVEVNGESDTSYVISNTPGCSAVYVGGIQQPKTFAKLSSFCANSDPFVSIGLYSDASCSLYLYDISSRVTPRNSPAIRTVYDINRSAKAQCYGNLISTARTYGFIVIETSSGSCDNITATNYYLNSIVGDCVPAMQAGGANTSVSYVQMVRQCSATDAFLSVYYHHTSSDCTDDYTVRNIPLGTCNPGAALWRKAECLGSTVAPTSTGQDNISFNYSSSGDLVYRNYVFNNTINVCQPAYTLDSAVAALPDFYFRLASPCTSTLVTEFYFGIFSSSDCLTGSLLNQAVAAVAFTGIQNAYNATVWYSASCPSAAAALNPKIIQFETLGASSCTAGTATQITATSLTVPGATCNSIRTIAAPTVPYAWFTYSGCSPNNEFLPITLYDDSACSTGAQAVVIPLGSNRCYNRPDILLPAFGSLAVRARCPASTLDATSAPLSYAFIEEYSSADDCSAGDSYRSYAVPQSTSSCSSAPLWSTMSANSMFSLAQICRPGDSAMFFNIYSDSCLSSSVSNFAWKTTFNVYNSSVSTTSIESASTKYPPQCNIGTYNGQTVASKVTCFGDYTAASTVTNTAIISKATTTSVLASFGAGNTCYMGYPNIAGETAFAANFTHTCSQNDVAARYLRSDSTTCSSMSATSGTIVELNKTEDDLSTVNCFQTGTASPAGSDSFFRVNMYESSSCDVTKSLSFMALNTPSICQVLPDKVHSVMLIETCYEDDAFISFTYSSGTTCSSQTSTYTLKQGRDFCNIGPDFLLASTYRSMNSYCISPTTPKRPAIPSNNQMQILLQTTGATKQTVVISNAPRVTNATCIPAINSMYGSSFPMYYVKLIDGRCSDKDVLLRMNVYTNSDINCASTTPTTQTFYIGATNIGLNTNYTVECHTSSQVLAPHSQSVLFRTAYLSDNGCVGPASQSSIIASIPNKCSRLEMVSSESAVSVWVKSNISCDKAPINPKNGVKMMQLDYYSSSTCSEASKYANTASLFANSPNSTSLCSIDGASLPNYGLTETYICAQTSTYTDPLCPGTSPGASFTCVNGVWTSSGSVTQQTVTIGSSTTVVVSGDLNITESVIISGTTASLGVTGCVYFNGSVLILLTAADIEKLSTTSQTITYITYSSDNCTDSSDLSTLPVSISTSGTTGCKKLKSQNDSTKQALAISFTLDDSGCKSRWWIIVVAVVGGVVLLVVIAVLIVTFVPSARAKVRPFWVRSQRGQNANVA